MKYQPVNKMRWKEPLPSLENIIFRMQWSADFPKEESRRLAEEAWERAKGKAQWAAEKHATRWLLGEIADTKPEFARILCGEDDPLPPLQQVINCLLRFDVFSREHVDYLAAVARAKAGEIYREKNHKARNNGMLPDESHATFWLLDKLAETHPDLANDLARENHALPPLQQVIDYLLLSDFPDKRGYALAAQAKAGNHGVSSAEKDATRWLLDAVAETDHVLARDLESGCFSQRYSGKSPLLKSSLNGDGFADHHSLDSAIADDLTPNDRATVEYPNAHSTAEYPVINNSHAHYPNSNRFAGPGSSDGELSLNMSVLHVSDLDNYDPPLTLHSVDESTPPHPSLNGTVKPGLAIHEEDFCNPASAEPLIESAPVEDGFKLAEKNAHRVFLMAVRQLGLRGKKEEARPFLRKAARILEKSGPSAALDYLCEAIQKIDPKLAERLNEDRDLPVTQILTPSLSSWTERTNSERAIIRNILLCHSTSGCPLIPEEISVSDAQDPAHIELKIKLKDDAYLNAITAALGIPNERILSSTISSDCTQFTLTMERDALQEVIDRNTPAAALSL